MFRIMIISLLSFSAFAQAPATQPAPVNCGNDYNCFYQQLNLQTQQQKLLEDQTIRQNQEEALMIEQARLQEMQRQTDIMAEQAEQATFQADKIEAQEEEIKAQKAEIETLHQTIEQMEQKNLIESKKSIQ